MGIFSKSEGVTVTKTEFKWKKNVIKIEGNYLVSSGLITTVRIPLKSIETVVWSMNPTKPTLIPSLHIIGKGTVLADLAVGLDLISDIQDWFMENVVK